MVTITPDCINSLDPDLEFAGELSDHTPVNCSVVLSEEIGAETYVIVPGYGARARNYYGLQKQAAIVGLNTICVNPVYRVSNHQNRLQAQATEVAIHHAEDLDLDVRFAYAHSWGGAKLASLLHHGMPGIELAVFHATSGIESAFKNIATRPTGSLRRMGTEAISFAWHYFESGNVDYSGPYDISELPALVQQGIVASEHRKLPQHLQSARDRGVRLVGLWAETDLYFNLKTHPIFHHNEVLAGSVHTEPQRDAGRVAQKLVELTRLV